MVGSKTFVNVLLGYTCAINVGIVIVRVERDILASIKDKSFGAHYLQ